MIFDMACQGRWRELVWIFVEIEPEVNEDRRDMNGSRESGVPMWMVGVCLDIYMDLKRSE